jgi:hypothetical protein
MNSRRALFIAACLFSFTEGLFATGPAAAQFQPQQPAAASPWGQQPQQPAAASPWDQQPQQGLQGPPQGGPSQQQQENCMQDFGKLRDEAQKRALAIRAASARKASAKEACGLFNAFSDAELKMIKYSIDNTTRCGIPAELVKNLKQGHVKSSEIRTRVCQVAATPTPSAGPSLSDALSTPIPDASNIKSGRGNGTYDTLTGTPLGSK